MNIVVRALWFVFIGWWLAMIWLSLCGLLVGSIIFLPFGLAGAAKTWDIATLKTKPDVVIREVRDEADD